MARASGKDDGPYDGEEKTVKGPKTEGENADGCGPTGTYLGQCGHEAQVFFSDELKANACY